MLQYSLRVYSVVCQKVFDLCAIDYGVPMLSTLYSTECMVHAQSCVHLVLILTLDSREVRKAVERVIDDVSARC
jgi:hypothetical protein